MPLATDCQRAAKAINSSAKRLAAFWFADLPLTTRSSHASRGRGDEMRSRRASFVETVAMLRLIDGQSLLSNALLIRSAEVAGIFVTAAKILSNMVNAIFSALSAMRHRVGTASKIVVLPAT